MDYEVRQARSLLRWSTPILIIAIIGLSWTTFTELIPTATSAVRGEVVLRIYAGSVAVPLAAFGLAVLVILTIVKAIPTRTAVQKIVVRVANVFWLSCVPIVLGALLLARPLQQYYFPKHGYTRCTLLDGNPTIWFTDWVKNPAWCVKGKRREWVLEQARLEAQGSASSTETGAPK